jgi:hypothetical protein
MALRPPTDASVGGRSQARPTVAAQWRLQFGADSLGRLNVACRGYVVDHRPRDRLAALLGLDGFRGGCTALDHRDSVDRG